MGHMDQIPTQSLIKLECFLKKDGRSRSIIEGVWIGEMGSILSSAIADPCLCGAICYFLTWTSTEPLFISVNSSTPTTIQVTSPDPNITLQQLVAVVVFNSWRCLNGIC
jgi:hypothetical protein